MVKESYVPPIKSLMGKSPRKEHQDRPPKDNYPAIDPGVKSVSAEVGTESDDGLYTVVERKGMRIKSAVQSAPENLKPPGRSQETVSTRRRWRQRKQAVVLEKPGASTYAEMVKIVKKAVLQENVDYEITTRKSKVGNMILEISDKAKADELADALRTRLGESMKIRRPSPSIPLIIIGIEDSVDTEELRNTLTSFDSRLESLGNLSIREGL